jgi:hypothetical protein
LQTSAVSARYPFRYEGDNNTAQGETEMPSSERSPQSDSADPKPAERRERTATDLRRQYHDIGISAVAAAVRYRSRPEQAGRARDNADRSTARGWSRHS